ncbi:MAG: DegT/DnrJ/EryC1/StrS family aminotransferase [Caldilineaceae bacterium]
MAGRGEQEYVLGAVQSGWISSLGAYVQRFEEEFARFCGVDHAVSVSNGTTALAPGAARWASAPATR